MSSENKLTLGQLLRQERERRGITIEQVASATKINVRLLHALEEDSYKDLPAKPFIRGFVASYVRFVGLDAREVLTQFADFIDTRALDRPSREGGHSGYAFEKREGEQGSRAILGATMGAFALGGIAFLLMKPSLLRHKSSHIDKLKTLHQTKAENSGKVAAEPTLLAITGTPSPLAVLNAISTPATSSPQPTPAPAATPSSAPSEAPTAEAKPPEDPLNSGINLKPSEIKHKVTFRALRSVWVRYQVDDRNAMQFVLKQGKALVLRAQKLIKFQVSDPSAINYNYNNSGNHGVTENKNLTTRQNNPTLIFPPELTDAIQEVFPNAKPLSQLPSPKPVTPSPSPTT